MSIEYVFQKGAKYDIPKVEEKPDSDIPPDLKLEIRNALSVFKLAIQKLKISLLLPTIVEKPHKLEQHLENTKYKPCLELVKEFLQIRKSEPKENDYKTLKLIDYFQENHHILSLLPNWLDDIEEEDKQILNACEDVYRIADKQFHKTVISILAKEKYLHAIFWANEDVEKKIKERKQRAERLQTQGQWKFVTKSTAVKLLEAELAFRQYDNNMFVNMKMAKNQREIQRTNTAFAAKQQEHEEVVKTFQKNYETKLNLDLKKEKTIRDERNKFQLQLKALIQKYDETLYEKHLEDIGLQEEYEKTKQEFDIFYAEYEIVEAEHNERIQRRQRMVEVQSLFAAYTRAAIIIQKWWKKIKKSRKKKGRGAKKGEKAKKN